MKVFDILTGLGVGEETAAAAQKAIHKAVGEEFVAKDQYNKKAAELAGAKQALLTGEARARADEGLAAQLAALGEEYGRFKAQVAGERAAGEKRAALRRRLEGEGVNPRLAGLLEREFDLEAVTLREDAIEGWAELVAPVRERYAELFGVVTAQGVEVGSPPVRRVTAADPFESGFDDK